MQKANRGDGRVALPRAQRLSRYQSLRMDLTKSTARFSVIAAPQFWIFKEAFG
jgi:hypothetical protein